MKSIVLLMFLTGIILMVIGYTKTNDDCPPPKIEYRFIPRDFYQQQLEPNNITSQFNDMFEKQSPNDSYQYNLIKKTDKIDKYNSFFNVIQ